MKKILNKDICLKIIVIFLFFTLMLIIFQFINTYKKYNKKEDVYLVFYNGEQQLSEMPQKGNLDNLRFDHAECNNGANIAWNYQKWAPFVTNISKNQTRCKLYFSSNLLSDYFYDIADKDTTNLTYDDTSEVNLRYIGASPKNYIDIGDRDSSGEPILWRIIGVMNNMTVVDESGGIHLENLVKIIRAYNIGRWSWDSSSNEVNRGSGVNEWSQADLMTTLNFGAYWNKESGQCYSGENNKQTACDFSSIGLTPGVKDKLVKVRWNTGTIDEAINIIDRNKITAKYMYKAERSDINGKAYCSRLDCNDNVPRTTTWDGYIGLMYLSDYGYAVGGAKRYSCLVRTMFNWDRGDCEVYNWFYIYGIQRYTLTPVSSSNGPTGSGGYQYVFIIGASADVELKVPAGDAYIQPTAYLKNNIKIKENSASDYGSKSNPFVIEGVN